MNTVKIFMTSMFAAAALDLIWMGFAASDFYQRELAAVLRLKADGSLDPVKWAVLPIYLLIALGTTVFVVPGVEKEGWVSGSLIRGALFGLVLYGVYEFTNHALIRDWSFKVVVADTLWGCVLCAGAALAGSMVRSP